jgi:uncharacterized protein
MISQEFQIFVKPVGADCNLKCKYCYYLDKRKLYPSKYGRLMTDDILEKYIIQHIRASSEGAINFSWHGGEPLLAGIDFFRKAVSLQKKYKPSGSDIINGIQTNGTLLNDEWCRFLAEEKFITGISIDGPCEIHDIFRRTKNNRGTFLMVMRGYELLMKHGIIPEILCVVNAQNVKHPQVLYDFFKGLGARYISFLPLVEKRPDTITGVSRRSVPSHDFGVFLSRIFDEWVEKDIGNLKIQIFEEAIRTAFNQEHTLCIFRENCGGVPVLEHTGDFYPCDHYVDVHNLHGNINTHTLDYLLECQGQKEFGLAKSRTLPRYCIECGVRKMCNGECPRNRFITSPDGEPGLNYLCSGYRYFFNHCLPFIEAVSIAWQYQGPDPDN